MGTISPGLRSEKPHIYHFSLKDVFEVKTSAVDSSSGKYLCSERQVSIRIDSQMIYA